MFKEEERASLTSLDPSEDAQERIEKMVSLKTQLLTENSRDEAQGGKRQDQTMSACIGHRPFKAQKCRTAQDAQPLTSRTKSNTLHQNQVWEVSHTLSSRFIS